jgi:multidrug efflux pump subunit AcrA (membrane-fusion protein)
MSMIQWWKVATVLLVAGATASGVEWLGSGDGPGIQAPAGKQDTTPVARDAPTREVKSGKLEFVTSSRGSVEAAQTSDLYSKVEGQTTIIKIIPEGSQVKKGDVVAELDSASLRDRLVNQHNAIRSAEDAYKRARLTREVAEIALHEYTEGILKQEQQAVRQGIDGARSAMRKAEGRLQRTRRANQRITDMLAAMGGAKTPADVVAELDIRDRLEDAERALERERRSLEQAEGKREVLEKYTREKTIKELEGEIGKARADERAKQAAWELEKSKAGKLERQIASCTLVAPMDGQVIYANDPARMLARNQPQIEEGATVRERQLIIRIFDINGPMQINLKVPEAMVARVAPKMKARVKIDAFADQTLAGLVGEVSPLPDASNLFNRDIKVYTTRIQIGRGHPGIRPGMTAMADIILDEREDAIGVPVGAVVYFEGKDHVAVKTPDGRVDWRDVAPGRLGRDDRRGQGRTPRRRAGDPRPAALPERRAEIQDEDLPGARPQEG